MKLVVFFLSLQLAANGALIWSESFETYDTGIDNLEGQSDASWITDPIATNSISVIQTAGFNLPEAYGNKALVVGGITPVDEFNPGIAFTTSPTTANFTPTGSLPEAAFSVDLAFNSAGLDRITDSFRITFFDLQYTELATLLFAPSADIGFVNVYRSNTVTTFDLQTTISVDTSATLNLVMNFELNKWSGSLTAPGSPSSLNLFTNVDMTVGAGASNLGGFDLAWLRNGNDWGSNFMVVDNLSLNSQVPEPSSLILITGSMIIGLLRRKR